ncbi:hypothetical protein [Tardiphaga sp. 42S5]|uniref:hypothetical protein n=1 Tax=Tardiphaga sp. 42S5 TaxID=1404799 RepID=UPI002A5A48E0|nr:hypothetical protein [Tardiphaga sp. 42S5]WPO39952.1 hypothetical protein SFY93_20725 [Tardiphaga sp. 42S5]
MIKKRLSKAADRSFRLIAAMLMRRAIARLIRIDDRSLSNAGLSRTAVAEFLESPLRTDPHRFFSRKHAQRGLRDTDTTLESIQVSLAQPDPIHLPPDESIAFDNHRAQTDTLHRGTIMHEIRQMVSFRMQILTAGVLVAVGALSACSGSLPNHDAAQIRRDQPARCQLRPNLIRLSPIMRPSERVAEASLLPSQPRSRQPEARAGPPGRAG